MFPFLPWKPRSSKPRPRLCLCSTRVPVSPHISTLTALCCEPVLPKTITGTGILLGLMAAEHGSELFLGTFPLEQPCDVVLLLPSFVGDRHEG